MNTSHLGFGESRGSEEAASAHDTLKHLLLVEDDPRLGPIMRQVLQASWDVRLVVNGREAFDAATRTYFDVMIVDRRLPDMDGAELVASLRRRSISTPVLMLTALGQISDKVSGLDAGANDYMVKPFDFEELNARLRALTRDYSGRDRGIAIGGWTFFPADRSVESPYTGRILLTEKEAELLEVLARHPETVFSRRHLLSAVFDKGEQETTVDTYVHYIRKKTEKDLVETVRGRGYRLGTPV